MQELSVEAVMDLMRNIVKESMRPSDDALLHTDLSMAQIKALLTIAKDKDPAVGVVARELHVGLSAASQIVERLVKADLVERRPHSSDRRITQCLLTDKGKDLVRQFEARPQMVRVGLDRLSADELRQLHDGLSALNRVFQEDQNRDGDDSHGAK